MSFSMAGLRSALRYFHGEQQIMDFSGGLNLRDAPTELAQNESPDMWNVTLNERGGVVKRLGYSKWNASPANNLLTYGYYSRLASKVFWYSKTDGKMYSEPGSGVFTLRRTWSTGQPIQVVDFAGKVYATHPVDGLYSSADSGVTWVSVTTSDTASVPKGALATVWQNKLWISGDPADVTNVYFSAPGDATKWAAASGAGFNHIRDKDDAPVTAMFGGAATDFQTNPSLLIFKEESTYRIVDSSSAAYVTLDGVNGAGGPQAVDELYGRILFVSKRGMYVTTGSSKPESVSEKIRPQFYKDALNYAAQSGFCVGHLGDRFRISVARNGSSSNDLCIEYHPLYGWVTERSDAMGCYVHYAANTEKLLGGSPTVTGQTYLLDSGGSDDGASIVSRFLTKVMVLAGGHQFRANTVRVLSRGVFAVQTIGDFQTTGPAQQVTSPTSGITWGTDLWGSGNWGGFSVEQWDPALYPRKICRSVQFRVDETSSLVYANPALNESGATLQTGAWALYGIDVQFAPLGLS